jgi:hypothetical protein
MGYIWEYIEYFYFLEEKQQPPRLIISILFEDSLLFSLYLLPVPFYRSEQKNPQSFSLTFKVRERDFYSSK